MHLYQSFMKNCKVPKKHKSFASSNLKDFTIEIPLKSKALQHNVDESFVRKIEVEYATRYLQHLGIEPNPNNMHIMLKTAPLTSCEINATWNTSSRLADILSIFPMRKAKSFQQQQASLQLMKEERLKRISKQKVAKADKVMENIETIIKKQKEYDEVDGPEYARKKIRDIDEIKTTLKKINDGELEKYKVQHGEDANFLDSLNFEMLRERFIYPFCIEQGYASGQSTSKLDVVQNPEFAFPTEVESKQEALDELTRPLTFTVDILDDDMQKISAQFATKLMPQVTANTEFAKDILTETEYRVLESNLPRRKTPTRTIKSVLPQHFLDLPKRAPNTPPSSLGHYANAEEMLTPDQAGRWIDAQNKALQRWQLLNPQAVTVTIQRHQITKCLQYVQDPVLKRLIGLITHFTYWKLFYHMNPLPIDKFHLKQIFVAIATSFASIELQFKAAGEQKRKLYSHFYMPTILLAVRVEVCKLIQQSYPTFAKRNSKRLVQKVNDLITQILDPNQFLSRFSLMESRKDGIKVRDKLIKTGLGGIGIRKGFYTRSALVRSVIPQPADGKVRVLFGTGRAPMLPLQKPKYQSLQRIPQTERDMVEMTQRSMIGGAKKLTRGYDKGTVTFSQLSPINVDQIPFRGLREEGSPQMSDQRQFAAANRSLMQGGSGFKDSSFSDGAFLNQYNSVQTTQLPFSSRIESDHQDSKMVHTNLRSHQSPERSLFISVDQSYRGGQALTGGGSQAQAIKEDDGLTAYFETRARPKVHQMEETFEESGEEGDHFVEEEEDPSMNLLNRIQLFQIAKEKMELTPPRNKKR